MVTVQRCGRRYREPAGWFRPTRKGTVRRFGRSDRSAQTGREDHDEGWDVIEDNDQLRPDIETFEQLTGEVIHPQDEVPVRGDEVEREDFDQSP